ncbi:PKD domain-containing protein [Aquimarina sp. 2201CG1-2-11]|uniref:Ig-like domain-containing protein n=1 Tax=Aquimarina discodermiae TaxID=3231043 RepID=UPI0034630540
MKTKLPQILTLAIAIILSYSTQAQLKSPVLIAKNQENFINKIMHPKKSKPAKVKLSNNQSYSFTTNTIKKSSNSLVITGGVNNEKRSTFSFIKTNKKLDGRIILYDTKKAFEVFSKDNGAVFLQEVDINTLVCTYYERVDTQEFEIKSKSTLASRPPVALESLPGAEGVIYIDFDGELVTNTSWVNSGTIDAQSPNFSDAKITEIWKIMAEDFRPFNINVTTRRDIFEATPRNRRIMCIFTTTKDAAPGSGGVAYLNSFSWNHTEEPCWVYNLGTRSAGETGSHEVGHAMGLRHDGRPGETYYAGHGRWSPIMGWSANTTLGHWSIGEYPNANNDEDDIAIIANDRNGVGFQEDDHGNTIAEATPIKVANSGNVSADQNFGLISTRNDKDIFSFAIETGDVSFSFQPNPDYPNLNIQARILNELGEEVAFSDPNGLNASITKNLTEGTYYIEIDGVGEGNLTTGYSDYSSLGNYSISGSYTPGDNLMPPLSDFTATQNCLEVIFENRSTNIVNSYLWDFGDGQTSTEENPTHTYDTSGTYSVSLVTTNNSGNNKREKVNFITITTPNQPVINDQTICIGSSTTLEVTGNSDYKWYTDPLGGTSIASGATYQSPILTTNTTYYIEGIINGCATSTRTPVNIKVTENPQLPTVSDQNICMGQSSTLIIAGNSEYDWFATPTGGTSIHKGTSFTTPNLINSTTYYIESSVPNCKSATRTEITANVIEAPESPILMMDENDNSLSVSQDYSSYQWYYNQTKIENAVQSTYTPTEKGNYYVEVFNEGGCSSISDSFDVEETIPDILNEGIDLHSYYPNPVVAAEEFLYINGLTAEDHNISIVNLRGQEMLNPSILNIGQQKIDLSALPRGLYIILINNEPLGKVIRK